MTVEEYLTYCANLRLMEPMEIGKAVERAMARCGVTHFRSRLLRNLSGGYQQRIGIAQAIVHHPQFVVLDEPTNDLDVDTLRSLEEGIMSYPGCVLVTSHDRWFLDRLATHILAYEDGGHVEWFEGNFEEYEKDKIRRLGEEAARPHRYRKLV